MNQSVIQGIGFLALLFVILSFQKNKRATILVYLIIAQILFTLHFSLLHAWIGASMNALAAIRTFIFYQKEKIDILKNPIWLYIFIFLTWSMTIVFWNNIFTIFPVLAMTFDIIATWNVNTKKIRLLMLLPRPLWLIYNLVVGSVAGIIAEIVILISLLIGIFRFDIKLKK